MIINDSLVIIRGAGDIATGIAFRLYKSGFKIVMLEIEKPSVIRRKVSFADTIYETNFSVEDVASKLVSNTSEIAECFSKGIIPIMIDPEGTIINKLKPDVVIDAILAKKNLGTKRNMADIVIGIGPGFVAGEDVDAVVETKRGHNLGRVILCGGPAPNTGIPGNIEGYTEERVLRGNNNGKIRIIKDIGSIVRKDDVVAKIEGIEVKAKIDGVVRGMIINDYDVTVGMKIGDIDPRGKIENCYQISDKARAIGGGVLEAILCLSNNRE